MRPVLLAVALVSVAVPLHAQSAPAPTPQPPAAGAAPAAPAPPAAGNAETASAEGYSYNPDGRRDPFTSLLGTGGDVRVAARSNDGLGSMAVNDIAVRGILQSRGALVAMVQGPDNKTYIVHPGDRLLDGTIKSITPQGLVLIQDVNDPLSLVKQREVSKLLRSVEAVKQ